MELTLQSGKEDSRPYSILHLQDNIPFECRAHKNEFDDTKRIDCRFSPLSPKKFSPIENAYFKITGAATTKGYTVSIFPKKKMKLYPVAFNLSKSIQTYAADTAQAKQWTVLGYEYIPPLLDAPAPKSSAINFPVRIEKNIEPYVGGLDLKGNPIKITRAQDVTDYMQMKKAYDAKDYAQVLDLADYTLKHYPKTVFRSELMLHQVRAYHERGNHEKVVEIAKQFLRDYSSDQNVAEVLADTANAYGKLGQTADADYFYDRLFKEHGDSPFAAVGMIYKAKQVEFGGSPKRAMYYYQKALDTTQDVDVASQAAFRLAQMELSGGNTEKAAEYADKIIKANPKYLTKVRNDAINMSDTFVYRKDFKTGIRIAEALLNGADPKSAEHEVLLKNLGLRLAQGDRKSEALKRFNEYLKTYKYGDYVAEVRRAKDGLFFEEQESNATGQIKKYDELIQRYGNESVGRKALYKKAQVLFKQKKYKEVLELENELHRLDSEEFPKTNALITQSAIGLEQQYLKEGKCSDAMAIQKMYKTKLEARWDGLLFDCAVKTTQYAVAKKIAEPHLKSKSLPERQTWLLRMAKTQFGLGEYKQALKAGNELVKLLEAEPNPALNEVYRILYDASQRLGNAEGMIRYIKSVETAFLNDFKDIERYTQMVSLGLRQKNEALLQTYARKVMTLQNRTKTYTQTPYIEFTLAQSLQNVEKDAEALQVLKTLNARKLNAEKRSRQQYLIGAVAQKLGRTAEARAAFNASIKADKNSAWGKLAKDALALL